MASENSGQSPINALFERMLQAAFDRAATGAPGKTPSQVLDLMRLHAERMKDIAPEREAELKQAVSDLDLDGIEDPAIRRANAKLAESQQQKLTDVESVKAFVYRGFRDAKPEDAASNPDENGDDPTGGTSPPCPSGP